MELKEIIEKAKEDLEDLLDKEIVGVVSAQKAEEGWEVEMEVLERKSVPDSQNLLGTYALELNEEGEIEGYNRIAVRKKEDKIGEE